ncbi:tryptophan synthase beta subunit-like PLP-dependent enzyme [Tricladium varicosporioides]|nr:tryptophan synthase beta subunit-like PLP-dependent enzyme [Hymenoscyphus varicosporioides]
MVLDRRQPYENPEAQHWVSDQKPTPEVLEFHTKSPLYHPTPLISLPKIAEEVGVREVFVKDESERCGLPSFKILGASWATHCAIAAYTKLPVTSEFQALANAAQAMEIVLVAATDGNHGRAVARIAALLNIKARILVPRGVDMTTIEMIRGEGADVIVTDIDYDATVLLAKTLSEEIEAGILIQDTAFKGYEEIPQWIVDGYSTMMVEIDTQLDGRSLDLVVLPVGVGSLAQAVVAHSKTSGRGTRVLSVEPDTAACLWRNLTDGFPAPAQTRNTVMAGMNCGKVSTNAWPSLKSGIDASVTISDIESHEAVEDLLTMGVKAGPCGAATLAALRFAASLGLESLNLNKDSTVVLLSTEGPREYIKPLDARISDPVALTQALVRIESTNPGLSKAGGVGERQIADYIAAWLEHRNIETYWLEKTQGRPSVVGIVRGSGGGKSIMFNGHLDTVTTIGYSGDPLSGNIKDGSLYGRGCFDMKAGLAAALVTLAQAKKAGLRGDVIFTGVADEENLSAGTEELLKQGWTADGAIVLEPTCLQIVTAHKGFVWLEVDIHGRAAHGSRYDLGVDAICKAGHFLVELDKYSQEVLRREPNPELGTGSVHASLIQGGEEPSSYPAKCTITIERRTVPGETSTSITEEIKKILDQLAAGVADFKYEIRVTFSRSPFHIEKNHAFVACVVKNIEKALGKTAKFHGEKIWADSALLTDKGIPSMLFGVDGEGAHAATESVTIESIEQVTQSLVNIVDDFCA